MNKTKGSRPSKKALGAKYRVRHVVEKVGASELNATREQLRKQLEQQRAWMLLAKDSATSVAARKKAARDLAENKAELKAIAGLHKKKAHKKRRR